MSKEREKEIKQLMFLKNEIIKEQKKELKRLRNELEQIEHCGTKGYYNTTKQNRKGKKL